MVKVAYRYGGIKRLVQGIKVGEGPSFRDSLSIRFYYGCRDRLVSYFLPYVDCCLPLFVFSLYCHIQNTVDLLSPESVS